MNFIIRFRLYGIIALLLLGSLAWIRPVQAADPDPQPDDPARSSYTFIPIVSSPSAQPAPPTEPTTPSISCNKYCFYVDSARGSDSNSGTSTDKPWKSLDKLHSANLPAGSTVFLKRGSSWNGFSYLDQSGQSGLPITITAYGTGPAPLLSNSGGVGEKEGALALYGSYIVVDNIQIQDSYKGIYIGSDAQYNVIQNSEIKNTSIGVVIDGKHNLVTHNYIHDLRIALNTPDVWGDDFGANGVDLYNSYNEISYNRFVNCKAPSYDYGVAGGAVEIWRRGDYTSIHHNWVYETAGFMEVSGTGSAVNVRVFQNVIINATWFTGIHVEDITIKDFRVENNTLVELKAHSKLEGSYIYFQGVPSPDTYIFRNNIVYLTDYYWLCEDQFTHRNNLYYFLNSKTRLGSSLDPSELMGNPQFIDSATNDFHLKSTSPAINSGINLGYSKDFEQNPVPIGNLPDLGAYEYQRN